jgi:hypothetical protein
MLQNRWEIFPYITKESKWLKILFQEMIQLLI